MKRQRFSLNSRFFVIAKTGRLPDTRRTRSESLAGETLWPYGFLVAEWVVSGQ